MKFTSVRGADNTPRVAVVRENGLADVTNQITPLPGMSAMRSLIADADRAVPRLRIDDAASLAYDNIRHLPPVPDPSKIMAAPVNYLDHKAEMNEKAQIDHLGLFLKAPSSLIGSGDTVQLPYSDRRFDQEGELALVIGRTARHVPATAALDVVFGYMCLLDMTMRGGEDRSTRKSFDTFTPTGPYLVTADEVGSPDLLELQCRVNGSLRQRAPIRDLIWNVARIVAYASSVMTLYPGDIITTGTPSGVGQVVDGDHIDVEISALGRLSVIVSAAGSVPCPTLGRDTGVTPPATVTAVR